jgi:hypothetical protein
MHAKTVGGTSLYAAQYEKMIKFFVVCNVNALVLFAPVLFYK